MSKQSKVYAEQSTVMAERIRLLRNSAKGKKLTQAVVIDELDKKGIELSLDSLKSYEVGEHHVKAYSNYRMSVETLCGLADIFGVSTDYLLGRADIASTDPKLKSACAFTGLSERAVKNITNIRRGKYGTILDRLLSSSVMSNILGSLVYAKVQNSNIAKKLTTKLNVSDIEFSSAMREARHIHRDVVEDIDKALQTFTGYATVETIVNKAVKSSENDMEEE